MAAVREVSAVETGFRWLLSPIHQAVFANEYWARLPLRINRDDRAYYSSLLTEGEMEFALSVASRDPGAVQVLNEDDKPQPCRSHTQAIEAFRRGNSLRIVSMQRYSYPIALLSRDLERTISCAVNVNMYLTPGSGAKALRRHHDTHDVFVIQIHGNKIWRLYDSPLAAPLEFLPLQRRESVREMETFRLRSDQTGWQGCVLTDEFVLRAGDCLYLPRGYWHEAQSESGRTSCHLTIGLQTTTYLELLTVALSNAAFSDLQLREPLPFGFATDTSASDTITARLTSIAQGLAQRLDPAAALGDVTAHFLRKRPLGLENDLLDSSDRASLDRIDADSPVAIRKGLICAVRAGAPQAHILFGSQEFAITTPYEAACRFIARTSSFLVRELPGELALEQKLALVRQLMSEGLLVACKVTPATQLQPTSQPPNWLPMRVDLRARIVRWIEVGSEPVAEPFFHQTVTRLKRERRAHKTTNLEALARVTADIRLAGFIFHISRCGSTVLSNGLRAIPGTVVISEPRPVNEVLSGHADSFAPEASQRVTDQDRDALLLGLVAAYGRRRTGDEQGLIFKWSSWNILHIATFRRLWPQVPCIIVVRDPLEVAVSCLTDPPGWMRSGQARRDEGPGVDPGSDLEPPGTMTDLRRCSKTLAEFLSRAAAHIDTACRVIDYKDLTVARIMDVARFFGLNIANGGLEAVALSCSIYSKDPEGRRPFVQDSEAKQAKASDAVRFAVNEEARRAYEWVVTDATLLRPSRECAQSDEGCRSIWDAEVQNAN